jgi:copper(I)-binding protein
MMRIAWLAVIAALSLAACAREAGPPVVIADIEITVPRPGSGMSAGYLEIRNNSKEPLAITRVESPQFGKVELHESIVEDGIARMRPLDSLDIAPGQAARLERGGKHLMLMAPVADPDQVTLNFFAGEQLIVSVEARVGTDG